MSGGGSSDSSVYGTFVAKNGLLRRRNNGPRLVTAAASLVLAACVVTLCFQASNLDANNTFYFRSILDVAASAPSTSVPAPPPPPPPPPPFDLASFLANLPPAMRQNINATIDPCVDFHEFACGGWEETAVIGAEKTDVSYTWDIANDRLQAGLKAAMENDQGNVGMFYDACLDVNHVDSLGAAPALPFVQLIDTIKDKASLAIVVYKLHQLNLDVLFSWFVGTDHANATRDIMYITKGGLNLPDKQYYLDPTDEYVAHRAAYVTYLVNGLQLLGYSAGDAALIANDTMVIETIIAGAEHDDDDLYKLQDIPPRFSQADLLAAYPTFDWVTYFTQWGAPQLGVGNTDMLSVTWPKWLTAFDQMLQQQPLPRIQNYLRAHVFNFFAAMLSTPFLDTMTALDSDLYGTSARQDRWKKCLGAAQHAMPMGVGQLFVQTLVSPDIKPAASVLVEEIRAAFNSNLDSVAWMTPDVRAAARVKLAGINMMVAYPPVWPAYPFTMTNSTYVQNSVAAFQYATAYEFARLFRPVDRTEWDSSPAEINAFYQNGVNGVFLPAGILQSPFFNITSPIAQNYGSIGAIMGHELTHGFDNDGRKYDANGDRHPWWDQATIDKYLAGAQCITDQFDSYVAAGVHVHGNDTLGENIADLGGLKTSYNAFVAKTGGNPPTTDRQTFWTSYAQSWCEVKRPKAVRLQVLTDPHSPAKYRIIGPLSQLPAFSTDFSCPAGAPMNPPTKCVLW